MIYTKFSIANMGTGMRLILTIVTLFLTALGHEILDEENGENGPSPDDFYTKGTAYDDFINIGSSHAAQERCMKGAYCNQCGENYKLLELSDQSSMKVCCEDCGKYLVAGRSKDDNLVCSCDRVDKISGDCWKGSQCDECDSSAVGRINTVPICCAGCEASGLNITDSSCYCLHNGS